jgi:hypothetical protein
VKGSIYIAPGVSQLDGFYVAQPDTSVANPTTADTGVIWTCHDNNPGVAPTALWVSANCRTTGPNKGKLTFNGGVVAKQINMLRLDGDVLGAGAVPNELSSSATTAEVFNFTPEMVMGGAFFNGGNANRYKIESLISLPPVF